MTFQVYRITRTEVDRRQTYVAESEACPSATAPLDVRRTRTGKPRNVRGIFVRGYLLLTKTRRYLWLPSRPRPTLTILPSCPYFRRNSAFSRVTSSGLATMAETGTNSSYPFVRRDTRELCPGVIPNGLG